MKVELLNHMGDDLFVANVARVSFAKESTEFTYRKDKPKGSDEGLIEYLADHNHWCYDDKTEIFTSRGWVNFLDITEDDNVAQVTGWENNNFEFEFIKPDQIHKTWYEGEMYTVENSKISYSVTPHHKMLYMGRTSSGLNDVWSIGNSDELFGKFKRLQTSAKMKSENNAILYNEGRLLGFLLGDGYQVLKYNNPRKTYVRLKKDRKIDYLTEILNTLAIPFVSKVQKDGITVFTIDFALKLYKNGEKFFSIPDVLAKGADFCVGVYEGLINSDGSVKRNTYTFSSSSADLMELFRVVATVAGKNTIDNSSIHLSNPKHNENYRVMVQTRSTFTVNKHKSGSGREFIREYKGYVCCVSVPSGMLLVRRDGKQLVCGNTPFGHCIVSLRMKAPVPIRTQCFKHKQGFVENEESRRYIQSEPELFIPKAFRKAPEGNKKQGSEGIHPFNEYWQGHYNRVCNESIAVYNQMIKEGVAPEQARLVLPQGVYVNWVWTGSLAAFARFYTQRTDPHAQEEIRDLAEEVGKVIEPLFPVAWKALVGENQ